MLPGGYGSEDKPEPNAMERLCENPMALLLNYADGLKAAVWQPAAFPLLALRVFAWGTVQAV